MTEVGQHKDRWSEDRTQKLSVLHIDDDPFELERVEKTLTTHPVGCEFAVKSMSSATELRALLADSSKQFDLYVLDIHLDPSNTTSGIALASDIRRARPNAVIIMRSSADDISTIGECLRSGADDFISKSSDKGELSLRLYHSYRLAKHKRGEYVTTPTQGTKGKTHLPAAVGPTMDKIAGRVPLIIQSAISAVFISGESGTGKEVVANIFERALPDGTPFVRFNCGAIAPTLLESELFGHVKGAFTGAIVDKRGLFEAASGGWIFLDEVATLTPSAQVALLRVLENQEVMRVGSTQPKSIQVRILSATNEPIQELVKSGKFRGDLWQRLREAEITLAPLRDRMYEVEPLIEFFCETMPGGPYEMDKPTLEILQSYQWSEGNIRELRNTLRAMTETHVGKILTPLSVPQRIWAALDVTSSKEFEPIETLSNPKGASIELSLGSPPSFDFDALADGLMIEVIKRLSKTNGKLSLRGLSKTVGISRSTLSDRLRSLVTKGRITLSELASMVGVSETDS